MTTEQPSRISIVTPLLNRVDMLRDAIASIRLQQAPDVEHIVVDGGSTDGSQQVARDSGAVVIDAPGSGIYEALNIGLDLAQGEFLVLLNSDDVLPQSAISSWIKEFKGQPDLDLVRGRVSVEKMQDGVWTAGFNGAPKLTRTVFEAFLFGPTNINACMFRARLWKRIGPFATQFRISADREWLLRVYTSEARVSQIDDLTYIYRAHEESLTIGSAKPATARWVQEHLDFSRAFLSRPALSPEHKRTVRAFFAKESLHAVALSVAQGHLGRATKVAARSFKTDPIWPVRAVRPTVRTLSERLLR